MKAPNNGAFEFLEYSLRQLRTLFAPTLAMINETKYPYKKAVLKDCGGDLSKRWYIEYRAWSERKQKLVRKRWYVGFDEHKTYDARRKYGLYWVREFNRELPTSYVDWIDKPEPPPEPKKVRTDISTDRIPELLDFALSLYDKSKTTYKNYFSSVNQFKSWLDKKYPTGVGFDYFKKEHAQAWVDYLHTEEKLTGKTIENRIAQIKLLCNKLIERGKLKRNPFVKLSLPRVLQTEKNVGFTDKEIAELKKYCTKHDPFLWLVCTFIYYTFMRPIEIGRLRIKHLDFERAKIHVPGEISKSGKSQTVEMPEPLKKALQKYVGKAQAEDYVFTAQLKPGTDQISHNYFNKHFAPVRDALKLDKNKTLYSWKHTGVVAAYKNGVDLKAIQLQCRHHSIDQTDVYLKSLGFQENEAFISRMRKI